MGRKLESREILLSNYVALGLEPGSPWKKIKERHKDLVMVWHPDRFHDEKQKLKADEELKRLNTARDCLKDHWHSNRHKRKGICICQLPQETNPSNNTNNSTTNNASSFDSYFAKISHYFSNYNLPPELAKFIVLIVLCFSVSHIFARPKTMPPALTLQSAWQQDNPGYANQPAQSSDLNISPPIISSHQSNNRFLRTANIPTAEPIVFQSPEKIHTEKAANALALNHLLSQLNNQIEHDHKDIATLNESLSEIDRKIEANQAIVNEIASVEGDEQDAIFTNNSSVPSIPQECQRAKSLLANWISKKENIQLEIQNRTSSLNKLIAQKNLWENELKTVQ